MINQTFIDTFKPERRSEYARQQARPNTATQVHAPESTQRSPLPSAREIDAALQVKYGATRYGERWRSGKRSPGRPEPLL
jgi:hypothetical protein